MARDGFAQHAVYTLEGERRDIASSFARSITKTGLSWS